MKIFKSLTKILDSHLWFCVALSVIGFNAFVFGFLIGLIIT